MQEEEKVKNKFDRADLFLNTEKSITDKENFILGENKENLVREGVSLPRKEADLVEKIRGRVTKSGFYPTKSEIFRAGLFYLSELTEIQIEKILRELPKLKPGRKKI